MLDILKMLLMIAILTIFTVILFYYICEYAEYYITKRVQSMYIKNENIKQDSTDELNKLKDEVSMLKKALREKTTRFIRAKSDDLIKKEAELDILLRPLNVPNEGREYYIYDVEKNEIKFKDEEYEKHLELNLRNAVFDALKISDKEFFDFLKENIGLYKVKLLITPKTLHEYLQNKSELGHFIPRNIVSWVYADVVVYYEYLTKTYYIYIPVKK